MSLVRLLYVFFWGMLAGMSSAHELWIEPVEWRYVPGARIEANLRNGENFEGTELAWFDRNIARADVIQRDDVVGLSGRMGDRPALQTQAKDGLNILLYETTPSSLTYGTWEKFQRFIDHKDLPVTRSEHLAAGHPETGFAESYTRHAKSLLGVGSPSGADQVYGLETEFVMETNLYATGTPAAAIVRLFYLSEPRSDAQVEVFERNSNGEVAVTVLRTDADGRVSVPIRSDHTYMLDAVVLRNSTRAPAIYDTLWASMTFFVP